MTNRLAIESSPYLRQHAGNPVDWFPWGNEAFQKASSEDKPIFLSIGYSSCHWCHVMAEESFESEQVAAFLSAHYVSIKVDREERPDLDTIYMAAVQALTGGGGWPMSVFLTPQGHPFYGGTYYPPVPRHGLPSFIQVLHAVADAWHNRKDDLVSGGQRLVTAIRQQTAFGSEQTSEDLRLGTLQDAVEQLQHSFDQVHGGWGEPQKFPQPMILEFLLRYHHLTGHATALRMVTQTLEVMARSGMYDQLGGGFHRYAVDRDWAVPHFEKMLYDNAQLARVYLHAWQVTHESLYRSIAEETLDYVGREMTSPQGGFFSAQDADSEGEEGKFYLWAWDEVERLLAREANDFSITYGVTRQGSLEGRNILRFVGGTSRRASFAPARRRLWEAREHRVHPTCDDKILASWNGLMLAAFSEAARVLDREDYLEIAQCNGGLLLSELRSGGRLLHTWRAGQAKQNGFLEDYACLLEGLIELYQTTFEPRWFLAAQELADAITALFTAPQGGFYDTSHDHEALIARPRSLQDGATPSGNAMAATALLRLGGLAAETRYVEIAIAAMSPLQSTLAQHPLAFGQWLQALSYSLAQPKEIAIVGDAGDKNTLALLSAARSGYHPFHVVAFAPPSASAAQVPLLRGRGLLAGGAVAYVCSGSVCQMPVGEPEELLNLLKSSHSQ